MDNIYGMTEYTAMDIHGSVVLLKFRTTVLKLVWIEGFYDGTLDCLLCGNEEEIVKHFVIECEGLMK